MHWLISTQVNYIVKRADDLVECAFMVPGDHWEDPNNEFSGNKYRCVVLGYRSEITRDKTDPTKVGQLLFELAEVGHANNKAYLSEWDIQKCIHEDGFV